MTIAERRVLLIVTELILDGLTKAIDIIPSWSLSRPERTILFDRLITLREALTHIDDPDTPYTP